MTKKELKAYQKQLKREEAIARIKSQEKTPFLLRLRYKYLTLFFLKKMIWVLFRFVLLVGISYIVLFPYISKIAGSFMSVSDFRNATVRLFPQDFTLRTYSALFFERDYPGAFFNTLTLSLVCALIQTFVACLIGYGLAKFKFKGNKFVFMLVILTMAIPHSTLELSMLQHFVHFDIFTVQSLNGNGFLGWIFGDINLMDTHPGKNGSVFQIDGNMGGTACVCEMLMQSRRGRLILLPALPKAWKKGKITNFCAQDGITVSFKWENEKLTVCELISQEDQTISVISGDNEWKVDLEAGKCTTIYA